MRAFHSIIVAMTFALAMVSTAHAGVPWFDEPQDITLDIDNDGKLDRAVLVPTDGRNADLHIYLGAGDGLLDLSLKPSIVKKDITANFTLAFEANKKGSLVVSYGCGGCSNTTATTLTIVHRNGAFLVGGYTYAWETRDFGEGTCDINFLTGKATLAKDGGKTRAIKGTFKPVKLADWDDERHVKVCGF